MKLSRSTGYALNSIFQLAEIEPGGRLSTRQLAKTGGMPLRFLLQVMCALGKAEILQSHRGIDGGFSLRKPLEEVSLLQVIEAVDGPLSTRLPELGGIRPQVQQALREVLDEVTQRSAEILRSASVAKLLTGNDAKELSGETSRLDESENCQLRRGLMALSSSEIWLAAASGDASSTQQDSHR